MKNRLEIQLELEAALQRSQELQGKQAAENRIIAFAEGLKKDSDRFKPDEKVSRNMPAPEREFIQTFSNPSLFKDLLDQKQISISSLIDNQANRILMLDAVIAQKDNTATRAATAIQGNLTEIDLLQKQIEVAKKTDITPNEALRVDFNKCFGPKVKLPNQASPEMTKLFSLYNQEPQTVGALLTKLCDGKHGDINNKKFMQSVLESAEGVRKAWGDVKVDQIDSLVDASMKPSGIFKTLNFDAGSFSRDLAQIVAVAARDEYNAKEKLGKTIAVADRSAADAGGLKELAESGRPSAPLPSLVTPPAPLPRDGSAVLKSDGANPSIRPRSSSFTERALQKSTELSVPGK